MNTYKYVHAHLHEDRGRQQPRLPHASLPLLSPTARRADPGLEQPNEQKSPAAPRRTPTARSLLRREKGPERPGLAAPRGANPPARSYAGWGLALSLTQADIVWMLHTAAPPRRPARAEARLAGSRKPRPAIDVQTHPRRRAGRLPPPLRSPSAPPPRSPRPARFLRSPRRVEEGGRKALPARCPSAAGPQRRCGAPPGGGRLPYSPRPGSGSPRREDGGDPPQSRGQRRRARSRWRRRRRRRHRSSARAPPRSPPRLRLLLLPLPAAPPPAANGGRHRRLPLPLPSFPVSCFRRARNRPAAGARPCPAAETALPPQSPPPLRALPPPLTSGEAAPRPAQRARRQSPGGGGGPAVPGGRRPLGGRRLGRRSSGGWAISAREPLARGGRSGD